MGAGDDFLPSDFRVLGTDGEVQLNPGDDDQIRLKRGVTTEWEAIDTGEPMADIPAAIEDGARNGNRA